MVLELFNVVAPVFFTTLAGYLWVKRGKPFDRAFTGELVMLVGTPCLIFSRLSVVELDARLIGEIALAAALTVGLCGVLGYVSLRAVGLDWRALTPSMMMANTGNIGLPVALLAFGREGLAVAVIYFVVNFFIHVSVSGPIVARGPFTRQTLLLPAILVPVFLSAVAFSVTHQTPPAFLLKTTEIVGGMAIPLMLLTLGASIASLPVTRLDLAFAAALMRVALGFFAGVLVTSLLGLDGTARAVVLMQATMPVAVINFVFALRADREPALVASVIIVSTLMSLVTIPAILIFVG